ncbi:MAG TPA: DsbA family protein [Frankiaceae bacterium]|nr:DsbA family protein [Frankiaceae bacterium]
MTEADLHFYFDPVCPFAWMTSKWVRMVAAQRDYTVDWRFIALQMVNENVNYEAQFPPEYVELHSAGLCMLRVAAAVRAEHGRAAVGAYYAELGTSIWDSERPWATPGDPAQVAAALGRAGLPAELSKALDDDSHDEVLRQETHEALTLTGQDVGTPILHFQPPAGVAFFGPVISRLPTESEALELWEHVIALAHFPGFAEMKRSLRELPQLRALGVSADQVGVQEDWHGGSRKLKK